MQQGWIKVYRQIQDCEIWVDDSESFDRRSAWIDLLLMANHRDKQIIFDGKPMTVERGQYVTSVRKLAVKWGWGNQKALKYLKMLEELGMITKDSDSRRTLITIVNYEVYQDTDNTDRTQTDTVTERKQNANRTQTERKSTTNKNIKNDKNEKNDKNVKNEKKIREVFFPDNPILDESFREYVEMRKKLKKPFTSDHAVELAMNKLDKLSGGNDSVAIEIVNQSIENSWQGLFELKGNTKPQGTSRLDILRAL